MIIQQSASVFESRTTGCSQIAKTFKERGHLAPTVGFFWVPPKKTTESDDIAKLDELFQNADGFIFCAPEYNGSTPPILANVISWISVKTSNWRGAFNGKSGLICTHSGGAGNNFTSSFRIQLNHLGVIVLPRTISKTEDLPFKPESASQILDQLISIT